MQAIAERYVRLVLAVGQHDAAYVDAYYGPPQWRDEAAAVRVPLDVLLDLGRHLQADLELQSATDAEGRGRIEFLRGQVRAVVARIEQLSGRRFSFDEESAALYDAVAPTHPESYFAATLEQLEPLVPGHGLLSDRLERFRERFIVPVHRLGTVFDAAIAESRRQTRERIALPDTERFTVEFVSDKPWSGYNWYQGGYCSVIQVNTDLPVYVERVVDLAAHEGYPGHHLFNVLLERCFVQERGWTEFTVYPLFSPESLIAEGTANFGIDVAFPGEARARFDRDVVMPLAGAPVTLADDYDAVMRLLAQLSYAGNEAARAYLNGTIDRAAAVAWLTKYALMSPARAEQRTRFMDAYRSYVINYNLGQDMVRRYVDALGGTPDRPDLRWQVFLSLLQSPRLPSGLR